MHKTDSNVVWWGKRIQSICGCCHWQSCFPRYHLDKMFWKPNLAILSNISLKIYRNICFHAVNVGGRVASGCFSQPRNSVQVSGLRLWGNVDYLGNVRWRGEQQVQVDRYPYRYLQYLRYKDCRYVLSQECWNVGGGYRKNIISKSR